ncbi:MAG: hypothetical protein K0S80_3749 [Neobacillus sp.]|nr:hypothetical protein [Neobacillus sp.]
MSQYQAVIYYTPLNDEARVWYKYQPMTEEQADDLCELINKNDGLILPNGDRYNCLYMSAICEEVITKEVQ